MVDVLGLDKGFTTNGVCTAGKILLAICLVEKSSLTVTYGFGMGFIITSWSLVSGIMLFGLSKGFESFNSGLAFCSTMGSSSVLVS